MKDEIPESESVPLSEYIRLEREILVLKETNKMLYREMESERTLRHKAEGEIYRLKHEQQATPNP